MFRSFFFVCVCVRQVFVAFTIMVSPLWVGNRIVCGVKTFDLCAGTLRFIGVEHNLERSVALGRSLLRSVFLGCHVMLSRKMVAMKTILGKMMKG